MAGADVCMEVSVHALTCVHARLVSQSVSGFTKCLLLAPCQGAGSEQRGSLPESPGLILREAERLGEFCHFNPQHSADVKTGRAKAGRAQCFRLGNGVCVANNIKTFEWKLCLTRDVFDPHLA